MNDFIRRNFWHFDRSSAVILSIAVGFWLCKLVGDRDGNLSVYVLIVVSLFRAYLATFKIAYPASAAPNPDCELNKRPGPVIFGKVPFGEQKPE